MKRLTHWVIHEHPTWAASAVGALISVAVSLGAPISDEVKAAIIALVLAVIGQATHSVVTPTEKATDQATKVGLGVAEELEPAVVGTVGEVTQAARGIVGAVVGRVLR